VDSYCSPQKQFALLDQMLSIYQQGSQLLDFGVPVQELLRLPLLAEAQRLKGGYSNDQLEDLRDFAARANSEFERLRGEYAQLGKAAT
jgi:V/A-type H+-transporting ATPase subunit A